MYSKSKLVLSFLFLLEFLRAINADDCDLKRVPRSSDDPQEKLKFLVECPALADPMVSMASENQPAIEGSKLSNFFRSAESKLKPLSPKKAIDLNQIKLPNIKPRSMSNLNDLPKLKSPLSNDLPALNLPVQKADLTENSKQLATNLRSIIDRPLPRERFPALPEMKPIPKLNPNQDGKLSGFPEIQPIVGLKPNEAGRLPNPSEIKPPPRFNLEEIKKLRSPLTERFSKGLTLPKINSLSDEPLDMRVDTNPLPNNFQDILNDRPANGRFANVLKDMISSRNKPDQNPSPSDILANAEPSLAEEIPHSQSTLPERLEAIRERNKKILQEARSKIKPIKIASADEPEPSASHNDLVAHSAPSDLTGVRNGLSERARLLKDKFMASVKTNSGKALLPIANNESNMRHSITDEDIVAESEPQQPVNKFDILADKTKSLAKKLRKLIDTDLFEEKEAIKTMRAADLAPKFELQPQESQRNVIPKNPQMLTDKLKSLMNLDSRQAPTPLTKRQKDDEPIISASNSEAVSDPLGKLSSTKAKMAERAHIIADRIKNALKPAQSEMRSLDDAAVDNSNIEEIVRDAPETEEADMEGEKSDAVLREVPSDDVIDLTQEGSKTADICKCIRIAFPEKFENGHFVMKSQQDTVGSASGEGMENNNIINIPSFGRIPASTNLGGRLKQMFRSRSGDMATMADEMRPVVAAAPEKFNTELSDVERAKMADQGIRSLLEFVKIVDQVDQYITTKARRAISRLATVLTEDENARLL